MAVAACRAAASNTLINDCTKLKSFLSKSSCNFHLSSSIEESSLKVDFVFALFHLWNLVCNGQHNHSLRP